jgi:hypothetical protein
MATHFHSNVPHCELQSACSSGARHNVTVSIPGVRRHRRMPTSLIAVRRRSRRRCACNYRDRPPGQVLNVVSIPRSRRERRPVNSTCRQAGGFNGRRGVLGGWLGLSYVDGSEGIAGEIVGVSRLIFEMRNLPLESEGTHSRGTLFNGACIGYVIEWARKVISGATVDSSKPRERAARGLAAFGLARQSDLRADGSLARDLRDVWDRALAKAGLQGASVAAGTLNGRQLLRRLPEIIPPGGLCATSIAQPAPQGAAIVYHAVGLMRQHEGMQPGPFLFFDPRFGLYQCDNAADFVRTVQYLDGYIEPAWSFAISACSADPGHAMIAGQV